MLHQQISEVEHHVNRIMEQKAAGARVRSRVKWYEKAEASTRYFLGLEKCKSANKTLTKIYNSRGQIETDTKKS